MFYNDKNNNLSTDYNPMIGNGRLATVIRSKDIFMSGLFNGRAKTSPSHRARIPSTINIFMEN